MKTSNILPRNAEIDAAAADWVIRRDAGVTAEDEKAFAEWLARDKVNAEAYFRLASTFDTIALVRKSGLANRIAVGLKMRAQRRQSRRRFAAIGVAAALILGMFFFQRSARHGAAAVGLAPASVAQRIQRLPDGSVVELNAGAEIAVHFDTSVRHIELLRGEAMFRVKHDTAHPFIVEAGGVAVRAVGTAFNVLLGNADVEVLVTEGKVGVDDVARGISLLPGGGVGKPAILSAGERAVVDKRSLGMSSAPARVTQFASDEIGLRLAWAYPKIDFPGVSLAEATAKMNARNVVQLVVADAATGKLKISGTFEADDPETFARLAAATFGLAVEHRGDAEIVLHDK